MKATVVEMSISRPTKCPECGSTRLTQDYERGEVVCENCGLVLTDSFIDNGLGPRASTLDELESRIFSGPRMTYLLHDKGLSTSIPLSNNDSYGRPIPRKSMEQLYRLRKWQRRIIVSKSSEDHLVRSLQLLERMASVLEIPIEIRETAAVICRKASKIRAFRGKRLEYFVAASLYAACRIRRVPRTLYEIAKESGLVEQELGKCYRTLVRSTGTEIPFSQPEDYVSSFCNLLNVSGKTKKQSLEILELAYRNGMKFKGNPAGVAASSIYVAAQMTGEIVTQDFVAKATGVSTPTIRTVNKQFIDGLGLKLKNFFQLQ